MEGPAPLAGAAGRRLVVRAGVRLAFLLLSGFLGGVDSGVQTITLLLQDRPAARLQVFGALARVLGQPLGALARFVCQLLGAGAGLGGSLFGALPGVLGRLYRPVAQLNATLADLRAGLRARLRRGDQRHRGAHQAADDKARQKGPNFIVAVRHLLRSFCVQTNYGLRRPKRPSAPSESTTCVNAAK